MSDERVLCPTCGTPLQMSIQPFHATDYYCPKCKKYVPYGEEVVDRSVSHTLHDEE